MSDDKDIYKQYRQHLLQFLKENISIEADVENEFYGNRYVVIKLMVDNEVISEAYVDIGKE